MYSRCTRYLSKVHVTNQQKVFRRYMYYMYERYPLHAAALIQAGLVNPRAGFPTLQEARMMDSECRRDVAVAEGLEVPDDDSVTSKPDRQSFQPGRDTFVKFGFSRFWSVPIHAKLKELRAKYRLRWLRLRMAYHCFPNLQSILSADLGRMCLVICAQS